MSLHELSQQLAVEGWKGIRLARTSSLRVAEKGFHGNIVTDADTLSERNLLDFLARYRPNDVVISEERGRVAGASDSEYTWVLDPLDGTANFARGSPDYGIIIGVARGDTPVAGSIFLPEHDLQFTTSEHGVMLNGSAFSAADHPRVTDSIVDYCLYDWPDREDFERQVVVLRNLAPCVRGIRAVGSIVAIADILMGRKDIFVSFATQVWDLLGTAAVLSQSPVSMCRHDGLPLRFTLDATIDVARRYDVVVCDRDVCREVVSVVRHGLVPS